MPNTTHTLAWVYIFALPLALMSWWPDLHDHPQPPPSTLSSGAPSLMPHLAACDLSVAASSNPTSVCGPGQTVTLQASIAGSNPIESIQWSPSAGVANPTSASTSAVINATTTYEVTVTSVDGMNLITNGDFSNGMTGFTSSYVPGTGGSFGLLSLEGQYAIATNANATHTNFASCGDHTGGGNMIVVNGASTPNQNILCQTISVSPNTGYLFSAWVTSVVSESPAQLQLSVNGSLVGNVFNASAATCQWLEFSTAWNSGPASSAQICIVNQNTNPSGNDFAVDDVSFREVCVATDQVTVSITPLNANWNSPSPLCALDGPILLNDLLAPEATPGGTWTINGMPVNVFNPQILGPGNYLVNYTVGAVGCVPASLTQPVLVQPVTIAAWTTTTMCVSDPVINLNSLLDAGSTAGGVWAVNGLPTTIFNPNQWGIGTHQVTYTVGAGFCADSYTDFIVVEGAPSPLWSAQDLYCTSDAPLTLNDWLLPEATLGGTWQINTTSATVFDPSVLGPGMYTVTYTVGTPTCQASLSQPVEVVAPPGSPALSCGTGGEGIIVVQWNPVPGVATYQVDAGTEHPGTLVGTTYTINGLAPGEQVTVSVWGINVVNCIGPTATITCQAAGTCPPVTLTVQDTIELCRVNNMPFINLAGTVSGGSGGMSFWEGPGLINSGGLFNPGALPAGTYALSFVYQEGACEYTDTTIIRLNPLPSAAFSVTSPICVSNTAIATALGNYSPAAVFSWNVGTGAIVNGAGTGTVEIQWGTPGSKLVQLQVEDRGCTSQLFQRFVQVDQVIDTPAVLCYTGLTDITFVWSSPPLGETYIIYTIQGPNGVQVADTSYGIFGLPPETIIILDMVTNSSNACPGNSQEVVCTSDACVDYRPQITPVPPICLGAGPDTLQLTYTYPDTFLLTEIVWSGAGVVDPVQGIVVVDQSFEGQENWVYFSSTNTLCVFLDSIRIDLVDNLSADFLLPPTTCLGDTVEVLYTGNATTTASYDWDFGTATVVSGSGAGPYQLTWGAVGPAAVSLSVDDNACASELLVQNIVVQTPLTAPDITCEPSYSSVLFSWQPNAAADSTQATVLNGPTGTVLSDTSYMVSGLMDGQSVSVSVSFGSGGSCPDVVSTLTCETVLCPDLEIDAASPIISCWTGQPDTLQLTATLSGTLAGAQTTWTGPGIIDPAGLLRTDASMVGQSFWVYVNITADICTYLDSVLVTLNDTPTSDFDLAPVACLGDTVQVLYTGNATTIASYGWDFGTATVVSGSGGGPYQLTWSTMGTAAVSLAVSENSCAAPSVIRDIAIQVPLSVPNVTCTSDYTSALFTWQPNTDATDFEVALQGGTQGILLSDTSYQVTDLVPGQSVGITITFNDAGPCPDVTSTATCQTPICPSIDIDIAPVLAQCWSGTADTLQLSASVSGNAAGNALQWSGPGVVDAATGIFITDASMVGQGVWVYARLDISVCAYIDSVLIEVNDTPSADFDLPVGVCAGEPAALSYTGSGSAGAVYDWQLSNAQVISNTGQTYLLSWPSAQADTIRLTVSENGCTSAPFSAAINIAPPTPQPQLSCSTTNSSILFSWPSEPGVAFLANTLSSHNSTIVADTAYLFAGLNEGDAVTLELVFLSPNGFCADTYDTLTCVVDTCPDVQLTAEAVAPICWDGTDIELTLAAAIVGDTAGGTLLWSGPGVTEASTGAYRVTADLVGQDNIAIATFSNNGCTYSDTLHVVVNATPVVGLAMADTLCLGEVGMLSWQGMASADAVFFWDFGTAMANPGTGAADQSLSWDVPGSYTLSLVAQDGDCFSDTAFVQVVVPSALPQPILGCSSGFDNITVSWPSVPGSSGYELLFPGLPAPLWLSDTSAQFPGLAPGSSFDFTLTAFDAAQCADATVSLSCAVPACDDISVTWAVSATSICAGDAVDVTFSLNNTGGAIISGSFTDGTNVYDIPDLAAVGAISLSPTAALTLSALSLTNTSVPACSLDLPNPLNITVSMPGSAGTALPVPAQCAGDARLILLADALSGQDAGGQWSDVSALPVGAALSAVGTLTTDNLPAGLYRFQYTVGQGGACPPAMTTVEVLIHPLPVAAAGPDQALDCDVELVSIGSSQTTVGSNIRYTWSDNSGTPLAADNIIEVSAPGVYTLLVENTLTGCSQTDQVVVGSSVSTPVMALSSRPVTCFGQADGSIRIDSVTGGVPPYQVSLNGAAFGPLGLYSNLSAGVYELRIRDANGCETATSLELVQPNELQVVLISDILSEPPSIHVGAGLTLTALVNVPELQIDTVIWLPDTLKPSSLLSTTATPFSTTTFVVSVVDTNGCTAQSQLQVFVSKERLVYIPNAFSPNGDGINDVFMIYAGPGVVSVRSFQVFSRWGEVAFERASFPPNDPSYGWNGQLDGRPMNVGVFVYQAEVETIDGEVILFKGEVMLTR